MANSLTDIFAALQNGVVALSNFARQMTGSFNNILGQLTALQAFPILGGSGTYKIISFTRDLSLAGGIVSTTGVGFRPRFIQFQSGISGGGIWASQGVADGLGGGGCLEFNGGTAPIIYFQGATVIIQRDNPSGSNFQQVGTGGISLDADGFSLNWGKNGTPTAIASLTAMCFR